MSGNISDWRCVNEHCNNVLGRVIGGELEISERLNGSQIKMRGPNLVLYCPDCGTKKIWYTSDPLSRAIHQVVEVMASQFVYKTYQKANDANLLDRNLDE